MNFDESAMGKQRECEKRLARNKDQGDNQKVDLATQTPDKFMINEEQVGYKQTR